jgi:hypothetical protein
VTGQTGPTGAAATVEPCLVEDATSGRFFGTFQAAVNAAGSEDTLNVQGTCEGLSTIRKKNLKIQGQGPGSTLNGENQSGSVITIFQGAVSISGLTITGGNANVGGGIRIESASLTLTDSTLTGNTASFEGGGIYNEGTLTLTNSTVSGNKVGHGGGGIYSGVANTLKLTNSTVSANTAEYGGGILLAGGTAAIKDSSSVSGNAATVYGGGIFNNGAQALTIEHPTEVSGNSPENGY